MIKNMRASKPSAQRKHSTLHDCQSRDPSVSDVVLAHKTLHSKEVRSKDIQTDDLKSTRVQATNLSSEHASFTNASLTNVAIKGQTELPEDWNEQFHKHFADKGKTFTVPRILVDSAIVQNMLYAKNNVNVTNFVADGSVDARGNFNCFGTAHFYGPVKIHGAFEVDQQTHVKPVSLVQHMTEKLEAARLEGPRQSSVQEPIPVATFQCKQMVTDEVRCKDAIETKRISSQRAVTYKQEVNELTAETIQSNQIVVDEAIQCKTLQAVGIRTDIMEIDKELGVDYARVNYLEIARKINAAHIKATNLHVASAHADSLTASKAIVSELDGVKAKISDLVAKKSLDVQGPGTFHDTVSCQSSVCIKDKLTTEGSFSLADRMESNIGRPIQMKQAVQFHRPICLSNYQYVYFNTPQSSMSKPFRVDISDDTSTLIIDSDVANILSLEIKLPSNPIRGQTILISTNPSISTIQMRAPIPILNQPINMAMGSFVQYLFVEQPNKWFRVG